MKSEEIEEEVLDPNTGESSAKNVFIVFYNGDRLDLKIKKICEAFNAHVYRVPETSAERKKLLDEIKGSIDEQKVVIGRTMSRRRAVLTQIARKLSHWFKKVQKEKAIAHTLNKFNYDLGRRCLIGEGWCPTEAIESITHALRKARERSPGAQVPSVINIIETKDTPPTHFKLNKFTKSFQNIVNSYGIPRYREVNPAVFTCVTFPFLIGVMFGDLGHGFLLTCVGAYLVYQESKYMGKKLDEIFQIVFDGRYVLFLMGFFSMYCGLIYNECFAIPMNIFGSRWQLNNGLTYNYMNGTFTYPYPFGVDPVWKGAANELLFYNSLKMKMSIIIGIAQMSLGIFIKLLNSLHFHHKLDIYFEFIPQILFLLSTFGYLCFLIFVKWSIASDRSPLLLLVLINMFLPGSGASGNKDTDPYLYSGGLEQTVETILLLTALVCVPLMLIPKPVILYCTYKKKKEQQDKGIEVDDHGLEGHTLEEFKMSEIIVHQVLETIEFVLGCLSHTASYLRLWALSLAHSELATVFWEMLFAPAMAIGAVSGAPALSAVGAFVGFAVWFTITIGIIMLMETLSAFLHALRLHWVEFQSKFYKGDGIKFVPLSYTKLKVLGSAPEEDDQK